MPLTNRLAIPVSLLVSTQLQGASYFESIDGEFSPDRLTPTVIALDAGENLLGGQIGTQGGVVDLDYFTILIPEAHQLEQIKLLAYFNNADDGNVSFWALDDGPTFSVSPSDADAAATDFLGWSHLTSADPEANLLSTFSPDPLPSAFAIFPLLLATC